MSQPSAVALWRTPSTDVMLAWQGRGGDKEEGTGCVGCAPAPSHPDARDQRKSCRTGQEPDGAGEGVVAVWRARGCLHAAPTCSLSSRPMWALLVWCSTARPPARRARTLPVPSTAHPLPAAHQSAEGNDPGQSAQAGEDHRKHVGHGGRLGFASRGCCSAQGGGREASR